MVGRFDDLLTNQLRIRETEGENKVMNLREAILQNVKTGFYSAYRCIPMLLRCRNIGNRSTILREGPRVHNDFKGDA